MFDRARSRLTLLYIGIFVIVLGVFSAVFYFALATVLQPTVDVDPDVPNLAATPLCPHCRSASSRTAISGADLTHLPRTGS